MKQFTVLCVQKQKVKQNVLLEAEQKSAASYFNGLDDLPEADESETLFTHLDELVTLAETQNDVRLYHQLLHRYEGHLDDFQDIS